jgi:hypothetical protein
MPSSCKVRRGGRCDCSNEADDLELPDDRLIINEAAALDVGLRRQHRVLTPLERARLPGGLPLLSLLLVVVLSWQQLLALRLGTGSARF